MDGMTILAVEDDRTHLVYLSDVLRRLGYPVLAAAGHEEAEKLIRENDGSVHMILANAEMTDGRNRPLWRTLSRLCPGAQVVCMTNGVRVDSAGDADVLRKPLSLVDLVMKVDGAFRRISEQRGTRRYETAGSAPWDRRSDEE